MTKNSRLSFALAILILMAGAAIRLYALADVPLGLNNNGVTDLRLAETVRQGGVRVFFDLNGEGREVLYPALLATVTAVFGAGTVIYAFASFVVGMITQAVTFALARRLFGDLAGLAALGFMAIVWWPVMLSRLIGRETMLPLLVATVLLMLALGLPVYGRHRSSASQTVAFAGLGTAMAVGMYLHPVGIVVMLMALVFIGYYMAFGRPRLTDSLRRTIGFTVLLTLIFVVPYLLSAGNMPNLSGAVRLFTGLRMDDATLYDRAISAFAGLGIQGDMNPVYNVPGRPLIDPLSALLICGGALVALRYARRRLRYMLLTAALIILAPLGLFAPDSPSWLASAALMPVLALCFGLGMSALGRLTGNQRIAGLMLAILLVANGIWTTRDLFVTWPAIPAVQSRYNARVALLAQHVDRTVSTIPTFVCSSDVTGRNAPTALTNPRLLSLMLNNRAAPLRYLDCATSVIFPTGGERAQVIFPNLRILDATSPAVLQWIELGSRSEIGVVEMEVVQPLADRIGLFTTMAPVRLDPQASPGSDPLLPPVRLEGNLTFLGYERLVNEIQPGGILPVVTYWRVDGILPIDLTLFAHLYDDLGAAPLANQDSISVVPSQLTDRDIFLQVHFIQIPETLPERAYTIAVGAYRTQSRQRLGILPEPATTLTGSRLILYPVDVTRNP